MFLGEDLLVWLVLAFGGAMLVGNLLALVRPPTKQQDDVDLNKAPVGRTIGMAVIGGIAEGDGDGIAVLVAGGEGGNHRAHFIAGGIFCEVGGALQRQ